MVEKHGFLVKFNLSLELLFIKKNNVAKRGLLSVDDLDTLYLASLFIFWTYILGRFSTLRVSYLNIFRDMAH